MDDDQQRGGSPEPSPAVQSTPRPRHWLISLLSCFCPFLFPFPFPFLFLMLFVLVPILMLLHQVAARLSAECA